MQDNLKEELDFFLNIFTRHKGISEALVINCVHRNFCMNKFWDVCRREQPKYYHAAWPQCGTVEERVFLRDTS